MCVQLPGHLQIEPLLQLAEQMASIAAKAGLSIGDIPGQPAPPPMAAAASPAPA